MSASSRSIKARTLVLASAKPRNPLVALAIQRKAGEHGPSPKAVRQTMKRDLAKQLKAD